MPPEEFRSHAHTVVDWMADYLREVGRYPVLSRVRPGEIRASLPPRSPSSGDPFEDLLSDFQQLVLPGITHWNHPGFFGYFSVTGSGPGILGEMLSAALNVNGMVWRSSPAVTELEELAADWLRDLMGLPPGFVGTINDTASHSSLYALGAAREAAYPGAREEGITGGPGGRVYASREAHSSIQKAVMALGLGSRGLVPVGVDREFRMRPELLREAIREDRARGLRPVAVVATVGTTSTTSVDPVGEVAKVAREEGVWLHVDAAYAGPAAAAPEFREHFAGWEEADSLVVNPHKWLFTPVDCSLLYVQDEGALHRAFSLTPEYLRDPGAAAGERPAAAGEEGPRNLMDTGVALGRRFRALKLWFVLRYFGAEGIRERIREHVRLARRFAAAVEKEGGWEVVAPVPFSLVVFRYAPEGRSAEEVNSLNLGIAERVNEGGEVFLTHTRLDDRVVLRLAVGNLRTRQEHVERAWELLQEAAAALESAG